MNQIYLSQKCGRRALELFMIPSISDIQALSVVINAAKMAPPTRKREVVSKKVFVLFFWRGDTPRFAEGGQETNKQPSQEWACPVTMEC